MSLRRPGFRWSRVADGAAAWPPDNSPRQRRGCLGGRRGRRGTPRPSIRKENGRHETPYCLALAAALAWAAPPAAAQQDEIPAPWRLFGVSCQPGDADRIMEALGKRADPNATDANGNTSVHYAAAYSVDVLLAVIAHGGRCDARNSYGETPFHTAAAQGNLPSDPGPESVRMLRSITK